MKSKRKYLFSRASQTASISFLHAQITPQMLADGEATMQQALLANEQTFIRTEKEQVASLSK